MAEERVVKITNVSPGPLPEHAFGAQGCLGTNGCAGCLAPRWNGIDFPMAKGQTLVVKEDVGNHLTNSRSFFGKIKVTGGPYELTQILASPDGFFEMGADGKFKPLTIRADTTTRGGPQEGEGETITDIKRSGRFLAKGGDAGI